MAAPYSIQGVADASITARTGVIGSRVLRATLLGAMLLLGMSIVPLGAAAGAAVVRAIRDLHVTCLLCDRHVGGSGVEVDFFGEQTTLPAGPATLALRTGASLLPAAVYFDGKGHRGVVRPPVPTERSGGGLRDDVTRITQSLTTELEGLIRRAPEQWHLMQPNWPSDHLEPAGRRQAVR